MSFIDLSCRGEGTMCAHDRSLYDPAHYDSLKTTTPAVNYDIDCTGDTACRNFDWSKSLTVTSVMTCGTL